MAFKWQGRRQEIIVYKEVQSLQEGGAIPPNEALALPKEGLPILPETEEVFGAPAHLKSSVT